MTTVQLAVDQPPRLKSLCIVNNVPVVKLNTLAHWVKASKRRLLVRLLYLEKTANAQAKILFTNTDQALLRDKLKQH